ncbi:hypothetical protein B0H14DRAFT_2923289 [Mycena olivaceomarginata]|nr:hypothetical protein B0H14DRAFT_2923289 [Mycena olivaceomarginata]
MTSEWSSTLPRIHRTPWARTTRVALKNTLATSSRFLNLSSDFEFAGWGTFSKLKLTGEDPQGRRRATLQHIRGAGLLRAGTRVLGSVFYALPAVVAVCGVYSPISLFAATLTPELASALPISGAPILIHIERIPQVPSLSSARPCCFSTFAATAVVSAATASSYLAGEVALPFPPFVGAALVLVIFALVSLTGLKESARIAFVVLAFHMATMTALGVASSVHWARTGNAQLRQNWRDGQPPSHAAIATAAPGHFPTVLRNLHLPTIVLNTLMIALVLATVPLEQVLGGANVLSVLAQISAGPWLRKWIVVDAAVVLCGGLAYDRVVPQVFLRVLPVSGAPYVSVLMFTGMSGGASLAIVSKMFSLVWLTVMALFPLALLLLRFNRGRMPRARTGPDGVVSTSPPTSSALLAVFAATQNQVQLLRAVYWAYDQYPCGARRGGPRWWGVIARLKRAAFELIYNAQINHLLHMLLYVREENEETSCVKVVHFCDAESGCRLSWRQMRRFVDEAFPEITIDLIIVQGLFSPSNVAALADRLKIPPSLMFMSCPGPRFTYPIAEFGARVISL